MKLLTFISKKYNAFRKPLKWFVSEFILGLTIVLGVFISNVLYDNYQKNKHENFALKNISLSMSVEYTNYLFGMPKFSVYDNEKLFLHNFYEINGCLVRVSFLNNKAIAYFFIIIDNRRTIDLNNHYQQEFILGKDSYANVMVNKVSELGNIVPYKIEYEYSMNPRDNYYSEWYPQGRWANYNTIVYGTVPMGNSNKFDIMIIRDIQFIKNDYKDLDMLSTISKLNEQKRLSALPNVFGVISFDYEDAFDFISPNNDWMHIYQIFAR